MAKKPLQFNWMNTESGGWGFKGKSVLGVFRILGIPITATLVTIILTVYDDFREDNRLQETRRVAEEQFQAAELQSYFDVIGRLMESGLGINESQDINCDNEPLLPHCAVFEETKQRIVMASARTLATLGRLDNNRKRAVLKFINAAGLINVDAPNLLRLQTANFAGIEAESVILSYTNLSRVNFSNANLGDASLNSANLMGVDFSHAVLSGSYLGNANIGGANLTRADLSGAFLVGAVLLRANLTGADLTGAILIGANLRRATLTGTDLTGADLRGADLRYAKELTQNQIIGAIGDTLTKLPPEIKYPDNWLTEDEIKSRIECVEPNIWRPYRPLFGDDPECSIE